MKMAESVERRIRERLSRLYGDHAERAFQGISKLRDRYQDRLPQRTGRTWDENDVVLITYGDQVRKPDQPGLPALDQFLAETDLDRLIRAVHILPFSPYSSDDGFSVIDYRQVDPHIGTWDDIRRLGRRCDLMFDLVLNHVSSQSEWFQGYRRGEPPYDQFFISVPPDSDLSAVTRPRSLPLLTRVDTSQGEQHVWTTFSSDQVDLNYAQPDVLLEMLDVLLLYVANGARMIRLDAVAYLWKRIGTNCIHLPETHQLIKLLRDLLDALAPGVLLITETNVPHDENISYFGNGDEAHMVYQFSLPPLLLDAFLSQNTDALMGWLSGLVGGPAGTTFFNFTASHDGIGVRPLERLVSQQRLDALVDAVRARGGRISTRRASDGSDLPYELNSTYLDALSEPGGLEPELHARRFLSSQAFMLALSGVPGIYFHSLVGTTNDYKGAQDSGQARRINRRKFDYVELQRQIGQSGSLARHVYEGFKKLLAVRIEQPAFHPEALQEVHDFGNSSIASFCRTSRDPEQRICVVLNVSSRGQKVQLPGDIGDGSARDLLTGDRIESTTVVGFAPFQIRWLELSRPSKT